MSDGLTVFLALSAYYLTGFLTYLVMLRRTTKRDALFGACLTIWPMVVVLETAASLERWYAPLPDEPKRLLPPEPTR